MILIPLPPEIPSSDWLKAFAQEMILLSPGLSAADASRCALLAHAGTWLLEPEEAAQWWKAALDVARRERLSKGWR